MVPKKEVKILGIIPARGGSTRIPRKNIVKVGGKPLIYYSIAEAQKAKRLDAFIVSTDDSEIADIAGSYGADVPFLRPKSTAKKFSAEIEYQQHALRWLEKNRGWQPDWIVVLRPTAPLRPAFVIDEAIEFALANPHFTFITSVCPPPFHPYRMSTFGPDGKTLQPILPEMVSEPHFQKWGGWVPTQKLPAVNAHNALIDVIPARCIKEGIRAVYAGPIGGFVTDSAHSVDIDLSEDLATTELFLLLKRKRGRK